MGLIRHRSFLAALVAAALTAPVFAAVKATPVAAPIAPTAATKPAAPLLRLVPAMSQITFVARQIGVPMEGLFKRFDAQVQLDPRQPEAGQVQVRIDMGSVSMSADGESLLQDVAWFNTAKFPQAVFVSRQIKSVGPGKLEVLGVFTLKGVSQTLTVPVTLTASGTQWLATGGFTLPRLAYQVGNGDWSDTAVIANDVQVKFSWQLQGIQPAK